MGDFVRYYNIRLHEDMIDTWLPGHLQKWLDKFLIDVYGATARYIRCVLRVCGTWLRCMLGGVVCRWCVEFEAFEVCGVYLWEDVDVYIVVVSLQGEWVSARQLTSRISWLAGGDPLTLDLVGVPHFNSWTRFGNPWLEFLSTCKGKMLEILSEVTTVSFAVSQFTLTGLATAAQWHLASTVFAICSPVFNISLYMD